MRLKDVGHDSAHAEMRAGSGLSNPYLSAAGVVAAGLLGIKAGTALRLTVDGPCEEDEPFEKLPLTLDTALDHLEADSEMRSKLGEDFIAVVSAVKRFELARFHAHVTDWERNEYLEVYYETGAWPDAWAARRGARLASELKSS